MQRHMMKSKIHRATVTGASVDYVGSISIDRQLMAAADIAEGEQVHVDGDNRPVDEDTALSLAASKPYVTVAGHSN